MNYNKLYKKHKNLWGKRPNRLLQIIWKKIEPGSRFLDLGCGQGRDSLFMAAKNFKVQAVDISKEGIDNLKMMAKKHSLGMTAVCEDIKKFKIENNKYDIINIYDTLHFLEKRAALILIKKIKKCLKQNGYIIISDFTTKDALFNREKNKTKGFFCPRELFNLLSDFIVILYKEYSIKDVGHPGFEQPHRHHIVELIAQK